MVCSWRSRPVCPPQTSLWFICFYWWWWSGKECYKQQQMATYDRILFLKNDDKKVKGVQNSQSPEMLFLYKHPRVQGFYSSCQFQVE